MVHCPEDVHGIAGADHLLATWLARGTRMEAHSFVVIRLGEGFVAHVVIRLAPLDIGIAGFWIDPAKFQFSRN